ncbi:MAG: methylenetetrahydrofolate reductase [NAD(P)H] [Deltaproteobacteria bacterium]|nr:MAG: methylenetetrahydrofolate reductase [NAD(P)H] [Deltaproteobacteria bacterium]
MNFKNFYQDKKPRYSFEIFPAKDAKGTEALIQTLRELSIFDPAYISVTYGAMGSTQALTRDLVLRISKELKLKTAFHFTCVGSTRETVKDYVEGLKKEGVDLIVALRGDPPAGTTGFQKPENGFGYANELVSYLKEMGGFSMAVAGYPEKHIEAPSKEIDLQNLKRKVDAGADVIVTQLFFDNQDFFDFEKRCRAIGIQIPIIPGLMPIVNAKQIEKITKMCGAKLPESLHQKLETYKDDVDAVIQIGIDHAVQQARELLKNGSPGIHFYTLNKAYSCKKVIESL